MDILGQVGDADILGDINILVEFTFIIFKLSFNLLRCSLDCFRTFNFHLLTEIRCCNIKVIKVLLNRGSAQSDSAFNFVHVPLYIIGLINGYDAPAKGESN